MRVMAFDDAGNVALAQDDHRFAAALADFRYAIGVAGPERGGIVSPPLACTVPGCSYACRTYFPESGDRSAQALHVRVRAILDSLSVQAALDAIVAELQTAGQYVRV